ncbi:von Willebrand factor type A domain protein [Oceanicola granulosus HTCC2516]|uniref:von Willebrand factor type A domain protein n=1 Tax=Oceanicola granulosus (strain ATCC BAA-861 / DSM 15982 / KCTC 12143 / HTCC2516) TaxID=314256 RepID=Q2CHQ2_OCEGH|nr:VWA domain-containing protein [Oceanicola granulosus]EAR52242.1 von Willebrand factor type A domain protein [Oceanicola granulosus HTCC2516]
MRLIAPLLALLLLPFALAAQERPNTILVMDGSGSMWGQIDGVNKIVIAREVVSEILGDFPADQNLGLTVYGHRTRGDCTDIETVVAPATGTAGQIVEVVEGINPRGKTPMTDAIIAAAEALRYTEERATVVLVSDGIETCNPDPCAAARALEQAGIDFTAHVIGFDVTDPDALGQMQCIADETGGTFTTAANAGELSEAMSVVVEPEPVAASVTFEAVLDDGGLLDWPVIWDVWQGDAAQLSEAEGNPLEAELMPGTYLVHAYWVAQEIVQEQSVTLTDAPVQTVQVVFDTPLPTARLDAPDNAPMGSTVMVGWDGPDEPLDNIQVGELNGRYHDFTYTKDGSPVPLIMPATPGTYELRYVLHDSEVIATRMIEVTEAPLSLDAPETVAAGAPFEVTWEGPGQRLDNIQVGPVGGGYSDFRYTSSGNPLTLTAPADPGAYEVRYRFLDRQTILTRPIEVIDIAAALTAPDAAPVGETIDVGWDGPGYRNDYVSVARVGDPGYEGYTYVREGNPLPLTLPAEPGAYELRYVLGEDARVVASRPIVVEQVGAALTLPARAEAGATIDVGWEGPGYRNDYIAVSLPTDDGYVNYTYAREGNPVELELPTEPGDYEVRYVMGQDRVVLARASLEVTAVAADLVAPESAPAGATITVGWSGPGYRNDYIAVSEVGDDGYVNYTYTREGNPLELELPTAPGRYELRYVLGQDRAQLAARPIEVTKVEASLDAPDSAAAGEPITVDWTGPGYRNDYIAVSEVGDDGYVNYTYTREGNPLELELPTEPGQYELRYVLGQDRVPLARRPIEVAAVGATLSAPAEAAAGETVSVEWTGPGYRNDYIAVSEVGEDGYVNYTYTRDGAPAALEMPTEPGRYEIRYYLGQDRRQIASVPITLTPLKVELSAPASAPVGSTLPVTWDGPGYRNDFIAIGPVGDDSYASYAYTRDGNPAEVAVPAQPGQYEVRYYLDQDRRIVTRIPLEVSDIAVRLVFPPEGVAGQTLIVGHDGPDNHNDFIGIGLPGDDGYESYAYTRDGNPLEIDLPEAPGRYEVRYYLREDRRIVGRDTVEVVPDK